MQLNTKEHPQFSFVIPTYNRAKLVINAIESIIKSASKSPDIFIEIIVIDDGSVDNTKQLLQPYIKDSKLTFIENEKNLGANTSRNRGVAVAQGSYCVFLDSDDELTEDGLRLLAEHFVYHPDSTLLFMASILNTGKLSCRFKRGSGFYTLNEVANGLVNGDFLPIIKRELMEQCNFFDGISGFEGSIWIWLMLLGNSAYYSQKVGRKIQYLSDGLSNSKQLLKRIDTLAEGYRRSLSIFGENFKEKCPLLYDKFYIRYIIYNKIAGNKIISISPCYKKTIIIVFLIEQLPLSFVKHMWNTKNRLFGV